VIVALELAAAFVLIVGGAIWFTNAVEWLGHRLDLGAGAVGALLAAVGTALPESVIPIVALLAGGSGEQVQLAYGAIIGAPFMLATIAMLLIVGSAYLFRRRREQDRWLDLATSEKMSVSDLRVELRSARRKSKALEEPVLARLPQAMGGTVTCPECEHEFEVPVPVG